MDLGNLGNLPYVLPSNLKDIEMGSRYNTWPDLSNAVNLSAFVPCSTKHGLNDMDLGSRYRIRQPCWAALCITNKNNIGCDLGTWLVY